MIIRLSIIVVSTIFALNLIPPESFADKIEFDDGIYVDKDFGFSLEVPKGIMMDKEIESSTNIPIITVYFEGVEPPLSFSIQQFQIDPNSIDYNDTLPKFAPQITDKFKTIELKIKNQNLEDDGSRYKITYEFTTKNFIPTEKYTKLYDHACRLDPTVNLASIGKVNPNTGHVQLSDEEIKKYCAGPYIPPQYDFESSETSKTSTLKLTKDQKNQLKMYDITLQQNKRVLYIYQNGEAYQFEFTSPATTYSMNVMKFDEIINTFSISVDSSSDSVDSSSDSVDSSSDSVDSSSDSVDSSSDSVDSSSDSVDSTRQEVSKNNGCLIATATYGTELASQVQILREVRDNVLLTTKSGTLFMNGFNEFYYVFSPTIADWERQNVLFREAVKLTITPLLSTMVILNYSEIQSEQQVLLYGVGVVLLNFAMYFVVPTILLTKIRYIINQKSNHA